MVPSIACLIRSLGRTGFLLCFALAVRPSAGQQIPEQAQVQMRQQASLLATQPARISVKAANQGIRVGDKSTVTITLLNSDNHPVAAPRDMLFSVALQPPSGAASTQQVRIPRGQSAAPFEFQATQTGLTSITVRPAAGDIRPDKTDVLVVRSGSSRSKARKPAPAKTPPGFSKLWRSREEQFYEVGRTQLRPARFVLTFAAKPYGPDPQNPAPPVDNSPRLHLSVNDVGSEFKADGKDTVLITAYYDSPDGSAAPGNIHLWFTNSNGELDPRPLVISAGGYSGAANLTSRWPATAHVSFVSASPSLAVDGDKEFDIHFVPQVSGMQLVGPEKLSVVDNERIMVVFFNAEGNPISTGKSRKVTLHSKQSKLRLAPEIVEVNQDSAVGSAVLFPVWLGSDTVEAVVENYQSKPLVIVVTGWLVLALCLGGGTAGGLAAYDKFGGSLFWRIFLGILGGAVLCWLYVYLALPRVDINLAHNTFSVFFVALIGGYLGLAALDFAAERLGLKPPAPPAPGGGPGPAPPPAPAPHPQNP